jgi:hypothetical protein
MTAYALDRPDGVWSLMVVNHDESNPHTVKVVFDDSEGHRQGFLCKSSSNRDLPFAFS